MRTPKCCIDGCTNKRQDACLHVIPVADEAKLAKWLDCINSQALRTTPKEKLRRLLVCQAHFEQRFIKPNLRLRYGAYPSLFTPEEISSGVPRVPIEDFPNKFEQPTIKRNFDHTYCKTEEPPSKLAKLPDSVPTCSNTSVNLPIEPAASNQPSTSSHAKDSVPTCSNTAVPAVNMPTEPAVSNRPSTSCYSKGPTFTVHKTPKASKKRLIGKLINLSPKCRSIYKEYKKAKNQVDILKRAKRALIFSKKNCFEDLTKNMNTYAKRILLMQINLCTKKKQARRYNDIDKLISLSLMKQSPKCYRQLRKIFTLPSKSTLNKLISQLKVEVGISSVLKEVIRTEVASWDTNKKLCTIIFDEMHLTEAIKYNKKRDDIDGFVHEDKKSNDFADQALVFMVRGAICKWQQPFAFYFCKGTTNPAVLKKILKEVVAATVEVGLIPVATICDQGTTFRKALQELQEETRREQILADQPTDETVALCGVNLSVIYDPSHLIKGLRNNFLNKEIELEGETSTWQDIVDVYLRDCNHAESRLLHKLTDQHVVPDKMDNRKKMKVKTAARVLSSTVSSALLYTAQFSHYVDGTPVSPTMANTAKIIKFFDNLFDSMNGASLHHKQNKGKELRKAVTSTTKHHSFWKEAITKLEKIKFKDKSGKTVSVPTLKSCVTTLKSLARLWQLFKDRGIKVMRPRYFNSDPIENFFGQVRAYNFRNNDPDCHSFTCTFRSLLMTRLITFHNDAFNCEDDPADPLLNLAQILKMISHSPGEHEGGEAIPQLGSGQIDQSHSEAVNEAVDEARRQRLQIHSRAYTAGWVVRKVLQRTPCDDCKKKLTTQSVLPIHNWVSHREFTQMKNRLSYPSETAVRCFGTVIEETNNYLENNPQSANISAEILNIIKNHEYNLMCPKHPSDHFFLLVIRFAINNWCNIINRILKGTDVIRIERRVGRLPAMQEKAYHKFKSKFKNKFQK